MHRLLYLSDSFCVDAVEYASRANAILGIRDSGKTYTATMIAEQLLDHGIPIFAFDPIGRWRFLRMPRGERGDSEGRGFPVVVAGGAAPDIELTPKSAPTIVRAALKTGVSVIFDLYSIGLSKQNWRDIVRGSIKTILYEGEGHGQRHVFLEEAAEFIPQRVRDGRTYAEVEKLARMGGNVGVGVTLINQRAEEVNKAVLELCDNLLLHRQRGKNSLISLHKWLDAGNVKPPKEITASLADLPTGQCWAWMSGEKPILLHVRRKLSFDPDRRAMATRGAKVLEGCRQETVAAAIEILKAAIAGKKTPKAALETVHPGERNVPVKDGRPEGELEVTRDEADVLTQENVWLKSRVAELENEIKAIGLMQKVPEKSEQVSLQPGDYAGDLVDAVIERIKERAPAMVKLALSVPELEVSVHRQKIEVSDQTLRGRVAALLADGFFKDAKNGSVTWNELKRRGFNSFKPNVYKECDSLAKMGFLFKQEDGYREVAGMKVNIIELEPK